MREPDQTFSYCWLAPSRWGHTEQHIDRSAMMTPTPPAYETVGRNENTGSRNVFQRDGNVPGQAITSSVPITSDLHSNSSRARPYVGGSASIGNGGGSPSAFARIIRPQGSMSPPPAFEHATAPPAFSTLMHSSATSSSTSRLSVLSGGDYRSKQSTPPTQHSSPMTNAILSSPKLVHVSPRKANSPPPMLAPIATSPNLSFAPTTMSTSLQSTPKETPSLSTHRDNRLTSSSTASTLYNPHTSMLTSSHPLPSNNVFAAAVAAANAHSHNMSHSRNTSTSTTATGLTSGIGTPILEQGVFAHLPFTQGVMAAQGSNLGMGHNHQLHPGTSRTPIPTSSPATATAVPMRFASPTRVAVQTSPPGSPPRMRIRQDSD
jgi:hypothetical protein